MKPGVRSDGFLARTIFRFHSMTQSRAAVAMGFIQIA